MPARSDVFDAPQRPGMWQVKRGEDVRIETEGQWTRGMCVVDRRSRRKREVAEGEEVGGDCGRWLEGGEGNRVARCVGTPGESDFGTYLLKRIFGS